MNFIEEYNKGKNELVYGVDYIDFMFGDYLLFIPLSRKSPAIFKFLDLQNCIVQTSSLRTKNGIRHDLDFCYFDFYVFEKYKSEKYYKCFLINVNDVLMCDKIRKSFISFYFKIEYNNIILDYPIYDGKNYFYDLHKINKTKYWKGCGRTNEEELEYFIKKKVENIIMSSLTQMLQTLEYKFDYKPHL
jgi:hypothetical protein